jgi:hypothetical protein
MDMAELILLTYILTFNLNVMKNLKFIIFGLISLVSITACSPEEDIKNPEFSSFDLFEDFTSNSTDGDPINLNGWKNIAEVGTVKWNQGIYFSDKYAEFSGYLSGQAVNIGWLISPKTAINSNTKIAFDVAQAYVSTYSNSLELLVSEDFDGTNVTTATWNKVEFIQPSLDYDLRFDFFSSGLVDLSSYAGKQVYIAFKVKGSGTNTSLDGTYEIDNVRIVNKY